MTVSAAFRGDFLFVITSKTSGTLGVSNSFPMFLVAGKRNLLAKSSKATRPIPAANAPKLYCLVACCSRKNGANTLLSRMQNHPLCKTFEFQRKTSCHVPKNGTRLPVSSQLDADCLYSLDQQFLVL